MEHGRIGADVQEVGKGPAAGTVTCALQEGEFLQRARTVMADFSDGLDQVMELPEGYALRFPGSEGWIAKLVDFILYERDCCPFFAFELVFEAQGGPVWLRLRGDGVKEFLELLHPLTSG